MKRRVYLAVVCSCFLALAGCAKSNDTNVGTGEKTDINEVVSENVDEIVSTEMTDKTEVEENTDEVQTQGSSMVPEVTLEEKEIPDQVAFAFVNQMKLGWNLGNTFDAFDEKVSAEDDLAYESMWCGAVTTKEMIDEIKAAGFETIRIPVSWHNHVSGDDFIISEKWLARVQEVVDYAIENDMYVIVNIHHDNEKEYFYPSSEYLETSKKYITSIWSQVGERFKDYDEHLLFEAMNEPRLVGTENEWWLDVNKDSCKDAVNCINQLNQCFVDTIRGQGGNNSERYLMIPGYGASPEGAMTDMFVLPTDTAANKMIVSVHAYTPYSFALQPETEGGSTPEFSADNNGDTKGIQYFMDSLYDKFISQGTPIVIGEFGARDKGGNLEARVDYATYYIAYARSMGITCCWWDNNSYAGTGENFGVFDRSSLTIKYPEIVEGLNKYAN